MLGKPGLRSPPHLCGKNVPAAGFDIVREVIAGAFCGVSLGDFLDSSTDLVNWAAVVVLAEVQMQRSRCNQRRDIGSIPVLIDAGNEVRETVQHVLPVNGGVRRQTAVADEALDSRLPRADEPGVRRAHRMAVATNPFGPDLRSACQQIDTALHVEDILPRQTLAGHDIAEELKPFVIAPFQLPGRVLPFSDLPLNLRAPPGLPSGGSGSLPYPSSGVKQNGQ